MSKKLSNDSLWQVEVLEFFGSKEILEVIGHGAVGSLGGSIVCWGGIFQYVVAEPLKEQNEDESVLKEQGKQKKESEEGQKMKQVGLDCDKEKVQEPGLMSPKTPPHRFRRKRKECSPPSPEGIDPVKDGSWRGRILQRIDPAKDRLYL